MYRYYVTKRSPVAAWILDDSSPFQECTGSSLSATAVGTPSTSVPLVSGAENSRVFKGGVTSKFYCNLFKRGLESRPFALESWILPIPKTYGVNEYTTNFVKTPRPRVAAGNWVGGYSETSDRTEDGVSFLRASVDNESGTPYLISARFNLIPGTGRTVYIYSKARAILEDTGGRVIMQARFHDDSGTEVYRTNSSPNGNHSYGVGSGWNYPYLNSVGVPDTATTVLVIFFSPTATDSLGDAYDVSEVMVTDGADGTPFFDGDSTGAKWEGAPHNSASGLKQSTARQQILSHNGLYDGLSIEGNTLRFGTSYQSSGSAFCYYDLGEYKLAHVVGTHSADQNQLWVNGELVASVDITEQQKGDEYVPTDDYLYCGETVSSQEIAVNGVAFYPMLSGDDIVLNYLAGIDFIGQDKVVPQYGGITFDLEADNGAIFIEEEWLSKSDFERGLKNNVELGQDTIRPSYVSGVSVAGSWTTSVPLDVQENTSIYGVLATWSGVGVSVDTSLDGTNWTPHTTGSLVSIIPNGYDPTGKDLQVRVNFAGGLADDPAYLDSLRITGYANNTVNNITSRPVTVAHPAVLRRDFEPNLYRDDNGVALNGGRLSIEPESAALSDGFRTLEMWVKPIDESFEIQGAGTMYRNGVPSTTLPVGEWSLVHFVYDYNVDNLHPDGSIEFGNNGYDAVENGTVTVDNTFSYSGTSSLLVENTSGGSNNGHSGNLIITPPGWYGVANAKAKVFVDPANGDQGPSLRLGGLGVVPSNSEPVVTKGEWADIDFSVALSGSGGGVLMYLYGGYSVGDRVWFDDLRVSLTTAAQGNAIIGQASVYPTPLTATEVSGIFKSYTGTNLVTITDPTTVAVAEDATPATVYTHSWAIDSAG